MSGEMIRYEAAKAAIAEAARIDEVAEIRDFARQMKAYAKVANDRQMLADASGIQVRAERKLGQLIINAKETGVLGIGRPARSNLDAGDADDDNGSAVEPFTRVTLSEAGISKKLSMKAQQWARLGDEEFEGKLEDVRERILSDGAIVLNPLKDLSTAEKKERRAEREQALGQKQMALPNARFGVIYADPEWKFQPYSEETGLDRSADNHYPTSALEVIKARDVASLAADDCVLFLWATVPMLPQALEVMAAWGFAYKTNFSWHKDRIGTGYWNRNRHELLLVGTRGNVPAPAMGAQYDSSIEAEVGAHSAKPELFYGLIESYFPSLPKIELNARAARPGWVRWGYEAPDDELPGVATPAPAAVSQIAAGIAFTRDMAEPILLARYATEGAKALAAEFGRPASTVRRWATELGLGDKERLKANGAHLGAYLGNGRGA
jgi:N6-adenosine-specific RNA methylase IME4